MEKKEFYKLWVKKTFIKPLLIVDFFAGILAVIFGVVIFYRPTWGGTVNMLLWAIPVAVFVAFVVIGFLYAPYTIYKDTEKKANSLQDQLSVIKNAQPNVEYSGLSPDSAGGGYFTRLVFKNKVTHPSGEESTAQALYAKVKIIQNGQQVDSWDGRWANSDTANSAGDITRLNCFDLRANGQEAILDIGYRPKDGKYFKGWDNLHYFEDKRKLIQPGIYTLLVTLGASNWSQKDWVFQLDIPDEPQSDNLNQVHVSPIQPLTPDMEGSQKQ